MRLIGTVKGEKKAHQFYSFLQEEQIECRYDPDSNQEDTFHLWVMHEDETQIATHWLEEFEKDTEDPRFHVKSHPIDTQGVAANTAEKEDEQDSFPLRAMRLRKRTHPKMLVTRYIILICVLLSVWNGYQMSHIATKDKDSKQDILTPLMLKLFYDIPPAANSEGLSKDTVSGNRIGAAPVWPGIYYVALGWPEAREALDAPMFVKIRQGEIWRLFTPVFLHGNFLHILFNMLWLWMLGRQVEERTKKWQYIAITLLIGILSNTFQYLMSGPFFLGYSGIVCGLAGFIWMRQRRAPWEGYPLQKGTIAFLAIFIVGMMLLQLVSFFLVHFEVANFALAIANTAHISGALIGIVLGRIPFFSQGAV